MNHPALEIPSPLRTGNLQQPERVVYEEFISPKDGHRYIDICTAVFGLAPNDPGEVLFGDPGASQHKIIGYVQLGLSQEGLRKKIRQFLISTLLFTSLFVLIGVGLTFLMTRRIALPIKKMVLATREISEGKLDLHVAIQTSDEISDLARAFNHMLKRLQGFRNQVQERTAELTAANEHLLQEITERKQAEAALQKAHDELEHRVEERTAELARANIQLKTELGERKRAEEALGQSEEKYRTLFEESRDAIYITAKDGRFVDINQFTLDLFGYPREELMQLNIRALYVYPEDRAHFQQEIEQKGSVREYEAKFCKKDGTPMDCLLTASVWRASNGNIIGYQGIIRDITEHKRTEQQILYLSFHDKLTDLYNRAYFEEELKRLDTERQLPISVIMGDVNSLKLINDAFGHHEGDKLLRRMAQILKTICRKQDLIARLGGDEFAVFLPKASQKAAMEVTKRIRLACSQASQNPVQLSIALGVCTKEDPTRDIQEILREAEDRMYRNKLLESKSVRTSIISSLETTLWERNQETEEHAQRMRHMAMQIGHAIGLSDSELDELALLASLHDIGKIAIPDGILIKPAKLSPEEWETMQKHPEIGYRIAESSPELAPIAEAILAHHEWWDGSGYPQGLKGEQIPLISRIITIVDAYDVMTHARPYKEPCSQQDALEELKRHKGRQFDPKLLELFLGIMSKESGFQKLEPLPRSSPSSRPYA